MSPKLRSINYLLNSADIHIKFIFWRHNFPFSIPPGEILVFQLVRLFGIPKLFALYLVLTIFVRTIFLKILVFS